MGQFGLFDADKRLAALSAKGDPLEAIDRLVPWESFRVDIEAVVLTPDEMRKSSAGRKPLDAIVMFRMLGRFPVRTGGHSCAPYAGGQPPRPKKKPRQSGAEVA